MKKSSKIANSVKFVILKPIRLRTNANYSFIPKSKFSYYKIQHPKDLITPKKHNRAMFL